MTGSYLLVLGKKICLVSGEASQAWDEQPVPGSVLVCLESLCSFADRPAHWPKPTAMVKDPDPQPFVPR